MFLGIDLGTSAVKTCVIDRDGALVAQSSESYSLHHPFEGASEQNCSDWWIATCSAIRALPSEYRSQILGVAMSGQMHGAVLLDANDQPIRPAILWNDSRSEYQCTELMELEPNYGDITGVWPMAGFTAPKVLWLSQNEPNSHERIASILLPKDYIGFRLHGEKVTDPSDAAGTSWFDQRAKRWSRRACEISNTDPDWLPDVRYGNEIAGHLTKQVADQLGLPMGIPIASGAGDAAAGAFGIGAVCENDGFISLGTSGQLFITQREYSPNIESRVHTYAHTHADHWFKMGAMLNGARPMAWLADILGQPITDLLRQAETEVQENLIFLPYLSGERTPHGDASLRGSFYGLSENTTPGCLMRAVIEAIAFSFSDAKLAFEDSGTSVADLLAIGGGTKSDLLIQTISDVLGARIGRSNEADIGPALGAARLAYLAVQNDCSLEEIAFNPKIHDWFEPSSTLGTNMDRKLEAYRAALPGLQVVGKILSQ